MEGDLDPKYTEVCSAQTIQSDGKGFFSEFFEGVQSMCSKAWTENVFNKKYSDYEKMKCMFSEESGIASDNLLGMLEHVQPVFKNKNAEISAQRRRNGEKLQEKGDLKNALILLSQAVLRAPEKGVDIRVDSGLSLALALWSRSEVLLELGDGENALSDLQYSLQNGLPAKQHGEYYLRLARANAMIGAKAKADICIKLAERLCIDSKTLNGLEKLKADIGSYEVCTSSIVQEPTLSLGENTNLKGASKLIELKKQNVKDGGNYVVAKENIQTGDILLVEKPVVSCLVHKFCGTNCFHCLKRLTIPYGCPNCSGVAFCSLQCKTAACTTYHKFECQFMDLFIGSGMSVLCFLALRIFTQASSVEEGLKCGRKIIADLCAHSDRRLGKDFLHRSTMSAFLLRVLQKVEYFGRRPTESAAPTEIELEVGAVILGLLQILQFNAHEIYETRYGEDHKYVGSKPVYIGVALYKTGAYFNHSCYPSVARYFVGTTIVLCATHPLQVGEFVGENYGPIFTKKTLAERQRSLMSRYWFKCGCKACIEDWKILDKLSNKARLKCPTTDCNGVHNYPDNPRKTVTCKKCRKTVSLQESAALLIECEEIYRRGAEYMHDQKTQEAIQEFSNGINLFYTIAIPPHKNTHIAEESLRACKADEGTVVPFIQL